MLQYSRDRVLQNLAKLEIFGKTSYEKEKYFSLRKYIFRFKNALCRPSPIAMPEVNDRTDRIAARLTDIAQRHRAASSGSSDGPVLGAWAGESQAPRDFAGAVTLDPVQEFES